MEATRCDVAGKPGERSKAMRRFEATFSLAFRSGNLTAPCRREPLEGGLTSGTIRRSPLNMKPHLRLLLSKSRTVTLQFIRQI